MESGTVTTPSTGISKGQGVEQSGDGQPVGITRLQWFRQGCGSQVGSDVYN